VLPEHGIGGLEFGICPLLLVASKHWAAALRNFTGDFFLFAGEKCDFY
jgi:hypothetical protein